MLSLQEILICQLANLSINRRKGLSKDLSLRIEEKIQERKDSLNYVFHEPYSGFPRVIFGKHSSYRPAYKSLDWIPLQFHIAELFVVEEARLVYKLKTEFRTEDSLMRMRVSYIFSRIRCKKCIVAHRISDEVQLATLIYRHGRQTVIAGYGIPSHSLTVDFVTDRDQCRGLDALICYSLKKVKDELWQNHTV